MSIFQITHREIQDPPLAKFFFNNTRMAWLWLVVRIYLGWSWLEAGWHKMIPAWLDGGSALRGYWENAVQIPLEGRTPISYDWYRSFILYLLETESYTWFAKLIAYGEILIGIGLIVGAFVGISAFFGALLNWNFIMAGSASTNGLLFTLAILLILAWKVAGYIGLDYYLLPIIGTPWSSPKKTADTPTGKVPVARRA